MFVSGFVVPVLLIRKVGVFLPVTTEDQPAKRNNDLTCGNRPSAHDTNAASTRIPSQTVTGRPQNAPQISLAVNMGVLPGPGAYTLRIIYFIYYPSDNR